MTFFWKKVFFGMGEKVGFTNCVFESCALLFSANTSVAIKLYVEKKKVSEKLWVFLNMAKGILCCVFQVLMFL